jgi:GT2 family glycosyltransferase
VTVEPAASVIVPVRNGGRDFATLVEALAAQTLPRERFEVVVGDDGSTDGATDGIETEDGWLRVLRGPRLNSYAARNRAAQAARSTTLAFCDADAIPDSAWLEAGLAALENADVVAGLIRFVLPQPLTIWSLLDMDMFLDQERSVKIGCAVTANLFVRRDLFEEVGAFDESLPNTGDFDFVRRCVERGAKLRLARDALVWHPARNSCSAVLRKVWAVNRRHAARESRVGRRPDGLRIRSWIPVLQKLRGRRRVGRSIGLDRQRLRENGVSPSLLDDLRALPFIYLVFPYTACVAQLYGWREGRRQ